MTARVWIEEIWNLPRNLASQSDVELERSGELSGRATLIYETSSDSRKERWEFVEDAPLLLRRSTYPIDSEGREILTEEETVVEYRLLPPGSSIPQLPYGRAQPARRDRHLLEYLPSRRSGQTVETRRPDGRARASGPHLTPWVGPHPAHRRIPVAKAPIAAF